MIAQKIWCLAETKPELSQMLAQELKIPEILARILANRGIYTVEEGKEFLWGDLSGLHSPWLLPDLKVAVDRIDLAISSGEKILLYGDYDVDGITSTTVLTLTLQKLGAQVEYYIPDRLEEGYGLNVGAMEQALAAGVSLIITVDCGISASQEAQWAREKGLDLIITDHHEVPEELPPALAVIDAKRRDSQYPCLDLAGVGVAFKLAQGLLLHFQPELKLEEAGKDLLDIVALGTIADIVPLRGENRIIVKNGLQILADSQRIGIQALKESCGLAGKPITAGQVGYTLAPRLNATGRLGDAKKGVRLLLSNCEEEAKGIAKELDQENRERQQIEAVMLQEAVQLIESFHDFSRDKIILLGKENWHPGVIGIVASRIAERYYRPTILLALDGEIAKGSCRSIPGFDMYQALTACQEYLEKFGGHKQAAGLTLTTGKLEGFRRAINELADGVLSEKQLQPQVRLDGVVAFSDLTLDLVNGLEQLQPFGHQNPGPILACREAKVVECKGVGKEGAHLKLRVKVESGLLDAIGFQLGGALDRVKAGNTLDLAFALEKNVWNNRVSLQLNLKDIKSSDQPDNPFDANYKQSTNYKLSTICKLVDYRDCQDRIGYVRSLVAGGGETLVYVSTPTGLPDHGDLAQVFSDAGKQPTNWQLTAANQGEGIINPDVENVILYNFPSNSIELKRIIEIINTCHQQVQVHLLFRAEEIALNKSNLEISTPGREILGKLYLLLRELARNSNPFMTTCSRIAQLLKGKNWAVDASGVENSAVNGDAAEGSAVEQSSVDGSSVDGSTVLAGLEIFAELELLNIVPHLQQVSLEQEVEIQLKAAPKAKLSLESSPRYCAGLAERTAFAKLGQVLLGEKIG
ncbi:MAG: single-stranded-DNA-specific exonuclease RecJ [Carboxydocellales bacterium]